MGVLLPGTFSSLGFFQESVTSSAQNLAALIGGSIPSGTLGVLIQAIGADVIWRADGIAPTISVGFTLLADAEPTFFGGAQARSIQLIQGAGGAATLNIGFYGP